LRQHELDERFADLRLCERMYARADLFLLTSLGTPMPGSSSSVTPGCCAALVPDCEGV
jgi:hypothetical protein